MPALGEPWDRITGTGDAEQMWITVVPALEDGEEDEAELVLLGIDPASDDPCQRVVDMLPDRGHEGEEGRFHLLPFDLGVRCERTADRLAALLLRREIATDFDPATEDGNQPVVLLLREGPAAEPDLFSVFDQGEAALAILGTWGEDE